MPSFTVSLVSWINPRIRGGTSLLGDEDVAENLAGARGDLVERSDDADAALAGGVVLEAPGVAAAGMDLRLDDLDRPAQFLGDLLGDPAARHGNTEFLEQALGLVSMDD